MRHRAPIHPGRLLALCLKHAPALKRNNRVGAILFAFALFLPLQTAQSAPAPSVALSAYRTIDGWVRSAAVPADPGAIELPGCTAVSVTLRRGGRVIGRGSVVVTPPATAAQALLDASSQAWIEASERLRGDNDALSARRLNDDAKALTIDLELAGQWTPIGGDTFADAAGEVVPGIEGVGARVGDRLVAVFPGTMQSSNRDAAPALLSAAGALDLPPTPLRQLRDSQGLVVYRFPVTRLTQITPGTEPIFLYRGGRITPVGAVTRSSLRGFANRLAGNLLSRRWSGDEPLGLMGTLEPWIGAYAEPVIAEPRSQALAALALTRWAAQRPEPGAPLAAVGALLETLAGIDPSETDPASEITSAAMTLHAINEAQRAGVWRPGGVPESVTALRSRCRAAVERGIEGADSIGAPSLALIACAAAGDESIDRSATEQLVRTLLRDSPPQELPALSPWLGWAELALHPQGPLPAGIALREHRSILWRHQITATGAGARQPDLIGAIVFTASRHPAPSWQTARALALIATMLGDARLTRADERLPEVVRLTRAMRFLMELTIDETDAALVPVPASTAIGAVRSSLTDQRAPLDATAMTLLTVCETIKALDAVGADR